jgi:hypothetical protein
LVAVLLVIDTYGHSRVFEILLGGTTQDLLERTPIPVLLSRQCPKCWSIEFRKQLLTSRMREKKLIDVMQASARAPVRKTVAGEGCFPLDLFFIANRA